MLFHDGTVLGLGDCSAGQCGMSSTRATLGDASSAPATIKAELTEASNVTLGRYVQVSAGQTHACFLSAAGIARCAGSNTNGELGLGFASAALTNVATAPHIGVDTSRLTVPSPFAHWPLRVTQVATGVGFTCVLLNSGQVSCVGANTYGAMYRSTPTGRTALDTLVPIPAASLPARHLCAGNEYACVVGWDSASLLCWGGVPKTSGTTPTTFTTVQTISLGGGDTVVSLSCGGRHACALMSDNTVYCGGAYDGSTYYAAGDNNNWSPNAGDNEITIASSTRCSGTCTIRSVSQGTGAMGSCAIATSSSQTPNRDGIYCWGHKVVLGSKLFTSSRTDPNTPLELTNAQTSGSYTASVGNEYLPWPLVQAVTVPAAGLRTDASGLYLLITAWVPYSRATAASPLLAYVDTMPCTATTAINATQWLCYMSQEDSESVATWPALVSLSWHGAPSGWQYGRYVCPRPMVKTFTVTPASLASAVVVNVTGGCFTADTAAFKGYTAATTLTARAGSGGKFVGTVTAVGASFATISFPAIAGAAASVVLRTNTALYANTDSPTDVVVVQGPPPQLTLAAPATLPLGGGTLTLTGVNFGVPGNGINVTVTWNGAPLAGVTHVSATSATVPFPNVWLSAPAVLQAWVEDQASNKLSVPFTASSILALSPTAVWAYPGSTQLFTVAGVALGAVAGDIAAVAIGGIGCTGVAWASATQLTCTANVAALAPGAATVGVTIAQRAATPVVNTTLLTVHPAPAFSRLTPVLGEANNTWVLFEGTGLGAPVAGGAVTEAGFRTTTGSRPMLPCRGLRSPPGGGGAYIACLLPAGNATVAYTPYATFANGFTVESVSLTFNFSRILAQIPRPMITGASLSTLPYGGGTFELLGQFFGTPGIGIGVSVLRNGAVVTGIVHVNDSAVRAPFPDAGDDNVAYAVIVDGYASNTWLMSHQRSTVSSLSPNTTWAAPASVADFTITGTGFGAAAGDISAVSIGGVPCTGPTRLSASTITCANVSVAAMTASTVIVTVRQRAASPASAAVLTLYPPPAITRTTPVVSDPGIWVLIEGVSLGVPAVAGGTAVLAGFQQTTSPFSRIECDGGSGARFPLIGQGPFYECLAPAGNETLVYNPFVTFASGLTYVASGITYLFTKPSSALSVTWLIDDFGPQALPSSIATCWVTCQRFRSGSLESKNSR